MTAGEAVAEHVRDFRVLRRLSQVDLAERMKEAGLKTWSRQTVGEVERGNRKVTVDELTALGPALGVPCTRLLDPAPVRP